MAVWQLWSQFLTQSNRRFLQREPSSADGLCPTSSLRTSAPAGGSLGIICRNLQQDRTKEVRDKTGPCPRAWFLPDKTGSTGFPTQVLPPGGGLTGHRPSAAANFYLCELVLAVWRDSGSKPNFSTSLMKATLCISSSGRKPCPDSSVTWNHPSQPVRREQERSVHCGDVPTMKSRRSPSSVYRQMLLSCSFTPKP